DWRGPGTSAIALLTQKVPSLGTPQNFVGWRFVGSLKTLSTEQHEGLGRALRDLFDDEQPVPERLQTFSQQLAALVAVHEKPQVAMLRSVASFYLTLWDPEAF